MALTRGDVDYVDDHNTAGRMFLELRQQADHAKQTGQTGLFTESKAALNKLERTWPDAGHHAATASEDDLGGLSPALKRTRDAHRRQRGVTAQGARAARRRSNEPKRTTPPREPAARRGSSPSRSAGRATNAPSRPRRAATRYARRIGSEAVSGAGSASDFLITALGASIALAVAYSVLSNADKAPKGRGAIELFAGSVRNALNIFIRPVDPLSPHAKTPTITNQLTAPTTVSKINEILNVPFRPGHVLAPGQPGSPLAGPPTPNTVPGAAGSSVYGPPTP